MSLANLVPTFCRGKSFTITESVYLELTLIQSKIEHRIDEEIRFQRGCYPNVFRIFMKLTLCNISPGSHTNICQNFTINLLTKCQQTTETHSCVCLVKNALISRCFGYGKTIFNIEKAFSLPSLPPVQNWDIRITAKLSPNSCYWDYLNSPSKLPDHNVTWEESSRDVAIHWFVKYSAKSSVIVHHQRKMKHTIDI